VSPDSITAVEHEHVIAALGSEVRMLVGSPSVPDAVAPQLAALELEAFFRSFHRRLTRFDDGSDLAALNSSPDETIRVSRLVALAVRAALWAAESSGGLVDPTLVSEIESIGYAQSLVGSEPAPLSSALASAPPRQPALPKVDPGWERISVDKRRLLVTRPAGIRLDLGGIGKGLAADLCAGRLEYYDSFVVDAGGDLQIGGQRPRERVVEIGSPFTAAPVFSFSLRRGAVATSGISNRIWRRGNSFAHHLLDPSTGQPAWTGVVQATALADSALEAEVLAKTALLAGPEQGRSVIEEGGGVMVLDSGELVIVGQLEALEAA
jgi:FAD:protein FMN transferase